MIKEVIVVEGKDDITAVKSAIDCEVIATSGFGYGKKLIDTLKQIEKRCGIIIFTDPDYMGKKIRRDLAKEFPNAKHAFLPQKKALKKGDIGVENASKEDIVKALTDARATIVAEKEIYTKEELLRYGLVMGENSAILRGKVSDILGIGYGNGKQFLNRLNGFQVPREEFEAALKKAGIL